MLAVCPPPPPPHVIVLVLSGMKGCGVIKYAKQASIMLQRCGVAVTRIDSDAFLGERDDECDLCGQCQVARKCLAVATHRCRTCPEALDVDRLNAAINREASMIVGSQPFVEGVGKGVLILEGAFVLGVKEYGVLAKGTSWWFSSNNTARSKKAFLLRMGYVGKGLQQYGR
jgi:hypothetical protein